ncbi:MAG: NUDIX hydrolase [Dehalogenimonas sp.]
MSSCRVKKNVVFTGKIITVREDSVTLPNGNEKLWEVVEYPQAVAIIAVDEKDNYLLVRQYRHAIETGLIEIPAGGVDLGETPEEAVRRELQEETGYYPNSVERLTQFYAAPGYSTEMLHLFLATDLKPSRLVAEDTDEITLLRASEADVRSMIKTGRVQDGKSIAGLLFHLSLRK